MVDNIGDCKTRLMTHAGVKDNIISMQRGENDNIFSPYSSEVKDFTDYLRALDNIFNCFILSDVNEFGLIFVSDMSFS